MCGIVGVINFAGKYQQGMENIMKQLLWLDTIRGDDATGIYALNKSGEAEWVKQVVDGWTFVARNEAAQKILRNAENHLFIMGHNRAGTMGSNNIDCAHPIVLDKQIGLVHNGTLTSWPTRPWGNSKPKADEDEHDSTAIAKVIAKGGVQEFVDSCYGAYSLVWHDLKAQTFNFLRNEDRPMAMVYTENCVFFGSEIGLLMWIIQRNGLKPVKHFFTKPNVHYTFEIGEPEPVEAVIRKNYDYYTSGKRFPRGVRDSSGTHLGSSSGSSGRAYGHSAANDDSEFAVIQRHLSEAERFRAAARRRDEEIAQENEEAVASASKKGSGASGRGNIHSITGGKPHGKPLDHWKSYSLRDGVLFSCHNYGEIHDAQGGPQFNVEGEPAQKTDFPEIIIKGVSRVAKLTREEVQQTNRYLWGTIRHILALESGNVILWVEDIRISQVEDPSQKKTEKRKPILIANDKGEVIGELHDGDTEDAKFVEDVLKQSIKPNVTPTIKPIVKPPKHVGALLEAKEGCQGCKGVFPKARLRFLEETYGNSSGRDDVSTTFRLCETCVETYAMDRKAVLPIAVQDRPVKAVSIKLYDSPTRPEIRGNP